LTLVDIRFAVRAEVQHRTEPFERAFAWFSEKIDNITRSKSSTLSAIFGMLFFAICMKTVFQSPSPLPAPDILKAVHVAKTFEPLIYYSESGLQQVSELQDTGVAVWDLGESLRNSGLTSSSLIAQMLDDLSENLKTLALEMTRFFSHVDGDIDGYG
jgi:hypothetical protein